MSRPETIERREATEPRRQEERLETVVPAQTAVIDRREDPTKMSDQPGQEVVTELTHQRRRDLRTTAEMVADQEAAAAKQVDAQVERLRRTAPDPWKHRSDGMQCRTCIWYVAKNGPASGQELGRCRRHAPTMSGYPVVFPVDWCGDHKLSEVRV